MSEYGVTKKELGRMQMAAWCASKKSASTKIRSGADLLSKLLETLRRESSVTIVVKS